MEKRFLAGMVLVVLAALLVGPAAAQEITWNVPYPGGVSDPAISKDNLIYIMAKMSFDGSNQYQVYAVNPDTRGVPYTSGLISYRLSNLAIGPDGTVYVGGYLGGNNGYLFALKPDLTVKWKAPVGFNVILMTPAIAANGNIYVVGDGEGTAESSLYAFDASGKQLWRFAPPIPNPPAYNNLCAAPIIAADGTIYACGRNKVYALNPDSGVLIWTFTPPIPDPGLQEAFTYKAALGPDGSIYLVPTIGDYPDSTTRARMFAFKADRSLKWTKDIEPLHITFPYGQNNFTPSIGPDGIIYTGGTFRVYAIDPGTGNTKWESKIVENYADWYVSSTPTLGVDGTVFVGARAQYIYGPGALYAFDAATGSSKWEGPIYFEFEDASGSGAGVGNMAIFSDGTLLVNLIGDPKNDDLPWGGDLVGVSTNCGGLAKGFWSMYQHDLFHTGRAPNALYVMKDITGLFNSAVLSGGIHGIGPTPQAAANKQKAFGHMLTQAQALMDAGLQDSASQQLLDAYNKVNGEPRPPDFVGGPMAFELKNMIQSLLTQRGAIPGPLP